MPSRLITLDNSGALRTMFDIESIDSDRGIIESHGYDNKLDPLFTYAKGAYSDSFGLTVSKRFFDNINVNISKISRTKENGQANLTVSFRGLPASYDAIFNIPKDL